MSEATAKKLNIPSETTYIRMPLDFLGRLPAFAELPISASLILAMIYTLNRISQKRYKHAAKIPYEAFTQRFGMSRETVSKYKQLLIDKGILEYLGKSRYNILAEFRQKDYIEIDDYLHNQIWEMTPYDKRKRQRKESKRLTRSATVILAFLERQNVNPKTQGLFISSQARIGTALRMPRTTAGDGVREIIAASLCNTEAATCGLTKYTVKPELLNVKRRAPKTEKADEPEPTAPPEPKPKKLTKKEQAEKDLRAAAVNQKILNHFAELRHVAEAKAERALSKALSDKTYSELKARLTNVSINLGYSEARGDTSETERLAQEASKLDTQLSERLEALGIDKRELTPQYHCRTCSDTGYDSGGKQCSCLKKFIENMQI